MFFFLSVTWIDILWREQLQGEVASGRQMKKDQDRRMRHAEKEVKLAEIFCTS